MTYHELQVASHFSFLRGVSSAEDLFSAAALLGYSALGITDRNSVGGLVRALAAAEATGVRLIAGCRLDLMDGTALLVWPEDREGWSRLTRLLTLGKSRAEPKKGEKGKCFLHWEDIAAGSGGLVAALVPDLPDAVTDAALALTADIFGGRAHLALTPRRRPGDALRLYELDAMACLHGVRSLATGDILYDSPDKRLLQDVVTAIRNKCTIDDLGFRRELYADRHLKAPGEMERRFRLYPDAVRATADIAERCTFSLRELSYQYPDEILMSGRSPQEALEKLAREALAAKFSGEVPKAYAELLDHELKLVGEWGYAPYFLTVNSIVAYARSQQILCQGRGSAANSLICYALDITSIDPVRHQLLFERFISGARQEPPDIDVDFEHDRREEVIQWIYQTYGHDHAALTAVVSRYRTRGAVREVGKALGLPEDMTGALSGQIWGWSNESVEERHLADLNLDGSEPRLALTLDLARQLIGTPRHLSQHPGGFVLTRNRLDDLVPIEPAAMEDRRVIEWEKDDIETLGFMKVDILGLGMLGCMRRAYDLLREHKHVQIGLHDLQHDDEATFRMIRKADTIGTFQIESRAQMSMLPRLKPKEFYDLVIQVAIVRPGPIQGDMVHPYLRRREGKEKPEYSRPELEAVLKKTLGVPLFQEQAMKVAIVGAGFTPAEADALRRSMATFKFTGGVSHFRDKMINGMVARGYAEDFATRTFRQIEGFGSYGFPESHAASFAKIAYASSWMKCHHPDIFCAALLNAQPMGFYQPAQIVRDAQQHGVEVRPVCINQSRWDHVLEERSSPMSRGSVRRTEQPCLGEMATCSFPGEGDHPQGGGGARTAARSPSTASRSPSKPLPASSGGRSGGFDPAEAGEDLRKEDFRETPTNAAHPGSTIEHAPGMPNAYAPLRLGLRLVKGLSNTDAAHILAVRGEAPFVSIENVWRRSRVPMAALEKLADADAFHSFGLSRRQALWQVRGLGQAPLPLFAAAQGEGGGEADREPPAMLAPMTEGLEVVEDYRALKLSLRAHPLSFLRPELDRRKIIRCADLARVRDGARIHVAGIVLIRQRPGSANVTFITIEDETGIANAILWQRIFQAQRRIVMSAAMIGVKGIVQREGEVIHVITDRLEDYTPLLHSVGEKDFPHRPGPGDAVTHPGAPDRDRGGKGGKIPAASLPPLTEIIRVKSRNFH